MVRLVAPGEQTGERASVSEAVEAVKDACEVLRRALLRRPGDWPLMSRMHAFDAMHAGAKVLEDVLRQHGRTALADDVEWGMAATCFELGPGPD